MMRSFLPFTFLLCSALFVQAEGPLVIAAPAEWKIEYKDAEGVNFYTLRKATGGNLLMISRWPAGGEAKQIPAFLELIADNFAEQTKSNPELKGIDPSYTIQPLPGEVFSGNFVRFNFPGGVQTIFMVSNGDGIWNGQFTGPEEGWKEAMQILAALKAAKN